MRMKMCIYQTIKCQAFVHFRKPVSCIVICLPCISACVLMLLWPKVAKITYILLKPFTIIHRIYMWIKQVNNSWYLVIVSIYCFLLFAVHAYKYKKRLSRFFGFMCLLSNDVFPFLPFSFSHLNERENCVLYTTYTHIYLATIFVIHWNRYGKWKSL